MSKYFINKKIDLVILCGGIGSRIKRYSKGIPKSLIKINNKSILTYILNEFKKYNFNKIYLLTGYKSHLFRHLDKTNLNFIPIECMIEKKLMGTGGALNNLKKKNINDFILVNGDTLLDIDILKLINTCKNKIGTISLAKNNDYKSNSKLANLSLKNKIVDFSNKEKFMNGGVYFFKKKLLKLIQNKNFSLENDLLEKLIKKKKLNGIEANKFFLDIGTRENLLKAPKLLFSKNFKPAVFLDRDGVVNYDFGYVHKFNNFQLRPGLIKGLKLIQKNNYLIFIVTNQAGIAKQKFTENDFINLHLDFKNFLLKKGVIINDVMYCPHHPKGILKKFKKNCKCRKPKNGMIEKIMNNYDINISKSFMIGDKYTDELCATKSNIYFEYAKKNFYKQIKEIIKKR